VATVKNITPNVLALFRADAPPIQPGDEVEVRDENFVDRAWPKSTWELIVPPSLEGYADDDTDDAYCWVIPPPEPAFSDEGFVDGRMEDPGAFTVEQVTDYLASADEHERTRVITTEAAGKARKGITEWSAS
jgi:hypothetical protein